MAQNQTFSKENENFYRCVTLLIDLGADVLREVLRSYYHLTDLKTFLQYHHVHISRLKAISSEQYDILYPRNSVPDDKEFDITLLCLLLRNLNSTVPHHSQVWIYPGPFDMSIEADVCRIREARNELYGHVSSTSMNDNDYNVVVTELGQIYTRIATNLFPSTLTVAKIQDRINDILQHPLEPEKLKPLEMQLKMWYSWDIPGDIAEIKEATRVVLDTTSSAQKAVDEVKQDVGVVKQDIGDIKQDVGEVKQDVGEVKQDIGEVKQDLKHLRDQMQNQFPSGCGQPDSRSDSPMSDEVSSEDSPMETSDDEDDTLDLCPEFESVDYSGGSIKRQRQSLEMRGYQLELAEAALCGENTIICAPTGSGKTYIALYIVQQHLQAASRGRRKVAFLARTTTLIKQQFDFFRDFLPNYQIEYITGESQHSSSLGMLLDSYDIFCMTPQILVNNTKEGCLKSLEDFSLIILDECHHTKRKEPYNVLMKRYLAIKQTKRMHRLPQIVGLTASIGVGKSKTDEESVDYILSMCAKLDVLKLSTVEKKKKELETFVNIPNQEKVHMVEQESDPCKQILEQGMTWIEDKLKGYLLVEADHLLDLLKDRPADKTLPQYFQWTRRLSKHTAEKVRDPKSQRFIVACAKYLGTFWEALEMNSLLGIYDVIKLVAKGLKDEKHQEDKLTKEETELWNKTQEIQRSLLDLSMESHYENPNLKKLSNILRNMMEEKGLFESRAMVFVKTRATCKALAENLSKSLKDICIEAHHLIGKSKRKSEAGMTEYKQDEVVKKFQTGEIKVLVATTIGGEGLNIRACNIVVSYNYAGNEITKIQMSGRCRQKESTSVLLANRTNIRRDTVSLYKVAMMYRAIENIKQMGLRELEQKINTIQLKKYQNERSRQDIIKRKEQCKIDGNFSLSCWRCAAFAVKAEDIRKIKNAHHVVIDKTFRTRVKESLHEIANQLNVDGLKKKYTMKCRKCPNGWGSIFEYEGVKCPILKLNRFNVTNLDTEVRSRHKKWINVPFKVPSIELQELANLISS